MLSRNEIKEKGRWVLRVEAAAISELACRIDDTFVDAVEVLFNCRHKVVVTGMGKSGHIATKIASTMASTGTPAFFLHPAEALHGDLGMMSRDDVLVAISNSGNTEEVVKLLPIIKRFGVRLISIVGNSDSQLGRNSDITLEVNIKEEACPLGLAPTASTTAALALGDALAIALLSKRGFKEEDFARFHPGGSLGRRLLVTVGDLMHTGLDVPSVVASTSARDVMVEMTSKKLGMTCVRDDDGKLIGIITDGDLRRVLGSDKDFMSSTAGELMSVHPKRIAKDELAAKAVLKMEEWKITALIVTDKSDEISGVVHMHDLLKAGVV